jgi:lipocalin
MNAKSNGCCAELPLCHQLWIKKRSHIVPRPEMCSSRAAALTVAIVALAAALPQAPARPIESVRSGGSDGYGGGVSSSSGCAGSYAPPAASPRDPSSNEFCQNPPTVPNLDLTKYANSMYYSLYLSGSALSIEGIGGRCITANYTLNPNKTVDVLNCQVLGAGKRKPSCVRAIGARRPGLEASKLTVSFPNFNPIPSPYNVAAVLGSAEKGYTAAAVYTCGVAVPGATPEKPGFFIIARSVVNRERTLLKLQTILKSKGYDVSVDFVPTDQTDCLYFNGPQGFDVIGGPPPGVSV